MRAEVAIRRPLAHRGCARRARWRGAVRSWSRSPIRPSGKPRLRDPGLGPEPRHEADGHQERPQGPCRQVHRLLPTRATARGRCGPSRAAPSRARAAARAAGRGGRGRRGNGRRRAPPVPTRSRRVVPGEGEEPEGKEGHQEDARAPTLRRSAGRTRLRPPRRADRGGARPRSCRWPPPRRSGPGAARPGR